MGLFSSRNNSDSFTGKEYNTLKAALDEGLQHAYQFGSDQQNIEDALNCLSAFTKREAASIREMMICNAASCVGGIHNTRIRSGFMKLLEHCACVSSDECIILTPEEREFLRPFL